MTPFKIFIALFLMTQWGSAAFAQPALPKPEEQLVKLKERLLLTPEQETSVKAILEEASAQGEKDRATAAGDRRTMMQLGRDRMKATDAKLEAVLTDEQKKKYAELREEMKSDMRKRYRGF